MFTCFYFYMPAWSFLSFFWFYRLWRPIQNLVTVFNFYWLNYFTNHRTPRLFDHQQIFQQLCYQASNGEWLKKENFYHILLIFKGLCHSLISYESKCYYSTLRPMWLTLLLCWFSHLESVFYIFAFFTVENDLKRNRNVRSLM